MEICAVGGMSVTLPNKDKQITILP